MPGIEEEANDRLLRDASQNHHVVLANVQPPDATGHHLLDCAGGSIANEVVVGHAG